MRRAKRIVAAVLAVIAVSSQMTYTVVAAEGTTPGMDGTGIVIDGYYDDWMDVPKTEIDWGHRNDETLITHEGAAVRDGNTLYVYFRANPDYSKKVLEKDNLRIKINGSEYQMKVLPVDANGNKQWESNPDLANGIYTSYGVFLENRNWADFNSGEVRVDLDVAYTVAKDAAGKRTAGDAIEFSIDLEKLAKVLRLKVDNIREIGIQNLFFGGDKWIESVGSPTYAVLFFLIALPMVAAGFYKYSKNKKGLV